MARIPDRGIERLKEEVALERLVAAAGVGCAGRARIWSGVVRFTRTARRRW
jgi:hypothetical protein